MLFVVILSIFMVGCGEPNPTKARQNVIDNVESYEVAAMPRDSFNFIVRAKDGAIWYVETWGNKVSAKTMMLPPTNVNTNR